MSDRAAVRLDDVKNGTIWVAEHPICWTVVVQWITNDVWILVSAPERAAHGGTCQIALSGENGQCLLTKVEVRNKLELLGAVQQKAILTLEES